MKSGTEIFKEEIKIDYSEPAAETNWEAFLKVIESRRSVRVYDKESPLPDSTVKACLRAALLAPNSSNLQPWEFYWVKSKEKKEKLVEYCLGQSAAKTAPTLIVAVARTKSWKKHRKQMIEAFNKSSFSAPKAAYHYYEKLVPLVYGMGPFGIFSPLKWLLFNGAGLFKPTPRDPIWPSDLRLWAAKSTALACENLMLSFRAAGFDSCPMEGMDPVRIKKLLGLSRDAFVVMVVSAGKRAPSGIYGPQLRFDENQFLFEV